MKLSSWSLESRAGKIPSSDMALTLMLGNEVQESQALESNKVGCTDFASFGFKFLIPKED